MLSKGWKSPSYHQYESHCKRITNWFLWKFLWTEILYNLYDHQLCFHNSCSCWNVLLHNLVWDQWTWCKEKLDQPPGFTYFLDLHNILFTGTAHWAVEVLLWTSSWQCVCFQTLPQKCFDYCGHFLLYLHIILSVSAFLCWKYKVWSASTVSVLEVRQWQHNFMQYKMISEVESWLLLKRTQINYLMETHYWKKWMRNFCSSTFWVVYSNPILGAISNI